MLKPAMLLLLNQVRKDRLGDATSPTFGGWGVNAGAGAGAVPGPVPGKIDKYIFFKYLLYLFISTRILSSC